MRSSIETLVEKKLAIGGFYHVVGSIETAFDFDIHRVIKTHLRVATPLEYRDNVEFGRVYKFRLRLIEEVILNEKQREIVANSVGVQYRPLMYRLSHAKDVGTGTVSVGTLKPISEFNSRGRLAAPVTLEDIGAIIPAKAFLHDKKGDRKYVRLSNRDFEQKTGLELEEMRDYVIRGMVDGVGPFKKVLERCAARQDVPIYLSSELSKKMTVGADYLIRIDSIEKLGLRPQSWQGLQLNELRPWSWKEVGSWVDTEGAVCSKTNKGTGNYQVIISQKEKRVLAEIAYFLNQQGLRSYISLTKSTGVYALHVGGAEAVARVIREIEPYIRTENKIHQISVFKESICWPRKRLWPSISKAREILGLVNLVP